MKDLVILVADHNAEHALLGLLQRPGDLGIREVQFDIWVHPQRDPGVYLRAHEFLRPFIGQYKYALVLLDQEGSEAEQAETERMRSAVQERLERNGWKDRCQVIVINPELEAWVWAQDPYVARALLIEFRFSKATSPLQPCLTETRLQQGSLGTGLHQGSINRPVQILQISRDIVG